MLAYVVDLARGHAPLTFDPDANPGGLSPAVLAGLDGPFLRLAVQAGAGGAARRGEPDRCDRCELREPDKLPMTAASWHGLSLRLAPGFPVIGARFVAAQIKANGGASPLFALRVSAGRLFADWRVGGLTVELHDAFTGAAGRWTDIVLGCVAGRIELWVDGRHVASARAAFETLAATRYLKLGPYRDKDPAWGAGPAAVDFRDIRSGPTVAHVLLGTRAAA